MVSPIGDKNNKNLVIQPYSGKVAGIQANPNKMLLDSKIKVLNKLEILGDRIPNVNRKKKNKEQILKDRKEQIQQLKNEIQELYTELTKG